MSLTSEVTMRPNAAPMMIPTAMSITFPRIANALNSFSMIFLLITTPTSDRQTPTDDSRGVSNSPAPDGWQG